MLQLQHFSSMLYDALCESSIHLSLRLEEPSSAAPNKVGRSMKWGGQRRFNLGPQRQI
jgi:hypothetical protein